MSIYLLGEKAEYLNDIGEDEIDEDEISDELEMPLSSVCARCRELQLLGLIEDSGRRKETPYGKTAIVWQKKDQQ